MEATYRRPRLYLHLGIAGLVFCLLVGPAFVLQAPEGRDRPARAAVAMTVLLLLAGLPAWLVLDYRRSSLTLRGSRVVAQGVVRRVEMDLADVVEARWTSEPARGGLVLLDGANRLTLNLGDYELDRVERSAVAARLREAIRPDVQQGWDRFADETRFGETTPRPGEALVTRADWARIFVPVLIALTPIAGLVWWRARRPAALVLVPLLAMWLVLHAITPAEGIFTRKLSRRLDLDLVRRLARFAAWWATAILGMAAFMRLGRRLPHPDFWAAAGPLAWYAGFSLVSLRLMFRRARRDREAAARAQAEGSANWTAHTPPPPSS